MNLSKPIVALCWVLFFFLHAAPSHADIMRVAARGSYGEKQIDLARGQLGKIQVYLMSAGEMVGGFEVSLFRDSDGERVATKVSDDYGIVSFEDLRPGSYTAILLRSNQMKIQSTIAIGDFMLEAYYPQLQEEHEEKTSEGVKEEKAAVHK